MAAKRSKDADRKRGAEKRPSVGRSGGTRVRAEPPPTSPPASGATAPDTLAIKAPSSMTKNANILRRICPDEIDDVLSRVLAEGHSELVLLGPGVRLPQSPDDWPDELKDKQSIFHLAEFIDDLHDKLFVLTQLRSLDLRGNKIGEAGAKAIASLTQLRSLNLGDNNLGEAGAKAIASLTQLTSLDLSDNKIGDAGAKAIASLTQLTSLALSNNSIGDAGVKAIASLTQLTSLNLAHTKVADLTPLASLSMLWRLEISGTKVEDLSPLIQILEQGVQVEWALALWTGQPGVFVEGCPLTHPRPEVIQQGHEAVLNYFREVKAQGVDRLFEAKLLIVGEGGAGKTSLLRRLYRPEQPLPTEEETTKGIDIYQHPFPLSNGRSFRLNVWDFGGQQIYHATHQFFLTRSSLYILLDDTRKDHKSANDEGFKYWLEVIELLSDRSPVLIFQNEKGGRSKIIDEAGIKGRFPNVKEVYRGDLEKPNAAAGLSNAIEFYVQRLPHIGEEVPAKWVAIRAAVEEQAQKEPYISQQDYFDIYQEHLDFDRIKALHLSRYLHDLGVFLHFQDDRLLGRTVILQNRWATEAVFTILDDEKVKGQQGRFTLADCERLWASSAYADVHLELLALMEKFELCYVLADKTPQTWLAPQLLSPSRPERLENWAKSGDLVLSYRYEFLPKGLISRLIVRMNRFVQHPEMAWVTGVLFEREGTELLAQVTQRGNEVVLSARGPENKGLLSVITSDLDALNSSYVGLKDKVGKWIPCVCERCRVSDSPEFFEQQRLLKRKGDNKLVVECPASYADVSVLELLDGLKIEHPPWMHEQREEGPTHRQRTIKIFLASSEELKDDRDAFDLYFRQQNDRFRQQGLYLEIVRWENFLDAMAERRLQDEYNQAVCACDIFVSLFMTKTGRFTEEEFDVAHRSFKDKRKPLIYTFFKNANISTSTAKRDDLQSLWAFQDKLKKLGHFYTQYDHTEHLKRQFRDQLDKLLEQGKL
jgi:internalin A